MSISDIIIGFDFGIKKIGVAVGQKLTYTTYPIGVLRSISGNPNWKSIDCIYQEWNPKKIIVGLPLKKDGSEQGITILSRKFAIQLKKRFNIIVEMHDERFTTYEARFYNHYYHKHYHSNHLINNINRKQIQIDSIAAAIILQSWLNQQKK